MRGRGHPRGTTSLAGSFRPLVVGRCRAHPTGSTGRDSRCSSDVLPGDGRLTAPQTLVHCGQAILHKASKAV
jgi:hypothetical protein